MASSTSGTFQNTRTQETATPFFPPPPSASNANTKKKSGARLAIPLTVNIPRNSRPIPRPQRRSNLRHQIGQSSVARKRRLNELPLPAITLSPRHWILVGLLLLSFLSLILGFIYADCVALPHTNDPSESITLDASTNTNTTTALDAYDADETRRLGFDTPKNLVILFFYTTTLPFATMFHVFVELVVLCYAKKRTATSTNKDVTNDDNDEDVEKSTDLRPLSLAQKHNTSSQSSGKFSVLLQYLPALSLTASLLLVGGWTAATAIQAHCELPIPDPNSASTSSNICPIQTRGHYMHGIHELSIVKNLVGWVLVLAYLAYALWCLRVNGLVWKAAREERKAARVEKKRVEQLGRVSVVRFTVEEDGDGVGQGKKGASVDVYQV